MYIIQTASLAFIKAVDNDYLITSDIEKSTKYNTIGEAMLTASIVNKLVNSKSIRVIRY